MWSYVAITQPAFMVAPFHTQMLIFSAEICDSPAGEEIPLHHSAIGRLSRQNRAWGIEMSFVH